MAYIVHRRCNSLEIGVVNWNREIHKLLIILIIIRPLKAPTHVITVSSYPRTNINIEPKRLASPFGKPRWNLNPCRIKLPGHWAFQRHMVTGLVASPHY